MVNKFITCLLVYYLGNTYIHAQSSSLEVQNPSAFFFWDGCLQRFVVIDDSTSFFSYNNSKGNWESHQLSVKLNESFSYFVKHFVAIPRKNATTLFIHEGCGLVYEFKSGFITRIDHSYAHMNQFGGVFLTRNNEPLLFGGYGLFSFKNFITRFDMYEREWFKVVSKGVSPSPRYIPISIFEKDKLFVIGGQGERNSEQVYYHDGWRFNFKTNSWKYLGKLNPKLPYFYKWHFKSNQVLHESTPAYYLTAERIYQFFPSRNKVKIWILKNIDKCISISQMNNLLLLRKLNHQTQKVSFSIESTNQFFGKLNTEEMVIFQNEKSDNIIKLFILMTAFILIAFIYFLFKSSKNRPQSNIELYSSDMNSIEKKFLDQMLTRGSNGMEMNAIYDFVNHDNPTIDTLKKRREQLIKDLRKKLSLQFNIDSSEVFLEKRLDTDKRMKVIILHPKIQELLSSIIM